ncbi:hypothetical protein pb186bvf_000388 [Paramecium bursaria]
MNNNYFLFKKKLFYMPYENKIQSIQYFIKIKILSFYLQKLLIYLQIEQFNGLILNSSYFKELILFQSKKMQKLYDNLMQDVDKNKVTDKNARIPTNLRQLTFQYEKNWFKTPKYQKLFQLVSVLIKIGLEDDDVSLVYKNMELQGIEDLDSLSYQGLRQLKDLGLNNKQIHALQSLLDESDQDTVDSINQNYDLDNLKSQLKDLGVYKGFKLYQYPLFKIQDILDFDSYRSMIVIGETGTGKSSFINYFINHYLEVKQDDNFRYQLVTENKNQSQAVSQTQNVNIYYIKPYKGKLGLRIIDTPGFLDTKGVQQDQIITKQIENCFKTQVESLSTICFLIKSSACRLTPSQTYVLSAILSMFGKDIIKNFVFIFTFSDGSAPQAVEALTFPGGNGNNPSPIYDKIQFINKPWYLQINNACLYEQNNQFQQIYWNLAQKCFEDLYINKIQKNTQQSLTMTRQVIDRRSQIMNIVDQLRKVITQQLNEITNVKNAQKQIELLDSELKGTKNFKIKDIKYIIKKVDLKQGEYTTNCIICNITCHFPCSYADDDEKQKCIAMNNGNCTVCQDKCQWNQHKNMQFRYESVAQVVETELSDLKSKYFIGQMDKNAKKMLINNLEQKLIKLQSQCMEKQKDLKDSVNELKKISLQEPCCQYQEQYVDLMIKQENDNKQPGFLDRITALKEMKEYWRMIKETESQTGSVVYTQQFLENNLAAWKKKTF